MGALYGCKCDGIVLIGCRREIGREKRTAVEAAACGAARPAATRVTRSPWREPDVHRRGLRERTYVIGDRDRDGVSDKERDDPAPDGRGRDAPRHYRSNERGPHALT